MPSYLLPSLDSEVYVKVLPAADVRAVQSKTAALLSLDYSFRHLNMMSDPERIVTLPVGMYVIK